MKYVIHIKTPWELEDKLRQTAHPFKEELTKIQHHSHVTLYTSRFANERAVAEALNRVKFEPLKIRTANYDYFEGDHLVLRVQSQGIQELHQQIIDATQKHINWAEIDPIFIMGREGVNSKYGSPFVGRFYNPHITIATGPNITSKLDKIESFEWTANSFILSRREGPIWHDVRQYS